MGLFNPNYNKPGKGVRKDEPEKKGAALFFELFSRKWRSYLLLNILYFITCIPAFIYYFLIASGFTSKMQAEDAIPVAAMISAFMVIFFAGSPFKSGFVYVLRNFVRQQHAWTVGDFFGKTKENLCQSIVAFIIDIIISTAFIVAISFYYTVSGTNKLILIPFVIIIIFMVIYAIMQSFTWCMMVTFELKLRVIYKNAYLLSMATFPVNILSLIIRFVATAIIFLPGLISYILIFVVFLSAMGLLEQMLSYPTIKKFMLDKTQETNLEEVND